MWPHKIIPFHDNMLIDTGIVPFLFMKLFLREMASQQTSQYPGY